MCPGEIVKSIWMSTHPTQGELELTGYSDWGTPLFIQMEAPVVSATVPEPGQSLHLYENDVASMKAVMPRCVM